MATVVDGVGALRGGALASSLHAHTRHGDPFVRFVRSEEDEGEVGDDDGGGGGVEGGVVVFVDGSIDRRHILPNEPRPPGDPFVRFVWSEEGEGEGGDDGGGGVEGCRRGEVLRG